MKKSELDGSTYMVLVNGEFAGWFNIPTGNEETYMLRAGLASNPTIIDMEDISLDIEDLPVPGKGFMWDGNSFYKGEEIGN